jgi:lipopolysaccharide transport protein LptA/LPS export ABC transporter protein LptC
MVVAADHQIAPSTGRRTGDGLALAGVDRAREFRKARQRTRIVRTLRVVLPISAVGLVGLYAVTIAQKSGVVAPDALSELSIRKVLPTDLVMKNPRYEGFNDDGGSYVFTAKTAQQDILNPNVITLNGIVGEVYQADKTRTDITAVRGQFLNDKGILKLFEQINVDSQTGLKARLTEATMRTKEDLLTSSQPVLVEFPNGSVKSQRLTLRQKAREATFSGAVFAELTPPPEEKKETPIVEQETGATAAMFTPSNGPIVIESYRLDLNDGSKKAVFVGNVRARQGDANLTSPELEVTYEGEGLMGPSGAAPAAAASGASPSGKVRRIVAKSPVVMKRANGDLVTSDTADFDAPSQTAVLTGEVVMTSGIDRRATSDQVELNEATGAIVLSGSVSVRQGGNELQGGRLAIDRKRGTAQLTTPPEGSFGPGRIKARLVRDGETNDPAKETADERGSSGAMPSFKTNPDAPIDLNADALDVDDQRKRAVFRGDVDATQDGFKIRCAELTAHYKGEAGLVDAASLGTEPADGKKPSSELTRLEARKDVRVTSKDGQSATGDWADFDAKANTVTMGGNVVLSRGKNMVRGTRLMIDMTTGESKIDTAPQNTVAAPSGGGWTTKQPAEPAAEGKGRASAVFFPQDMKEQEEQDKAKDKPAPSKAEGAPAVDGWSATQSPD